MIRSIWGRALVVACAISVGRADAQEGTVPVTITSTSKKTQLQIGRFEGRQEAVGFRHGRAVLFQDVCTPLCTTTPCMLQLPPGKIPLCTSQGADWAPHHSADVNVPPTGADVSLRPYYVKPQLAGSFLSLGGAVSTLAGGITLASWGVDGSNTSSTKFTAGAAMLGVGGALLAIGIPIAVLSGREGVASLKPQNGSQPTAAISLGPLSLSGTF